MLTFRTKCGTLLGIKTYHEYVVMNPRGIWYGYDSEPVYNSYGWERQFDMPDELTVLELGRGSVNWKDSKEKIVHKPELSTKMFCPCCGNLVLESLDQSDVMFCGRFKCYEWIKSNTPVTKKCVIFGGGTFSHVSCHLALAAPAFGETARKMSSMFVAMKTGMDCELVLTKMADPTSDLITSNDVSTYVDQLLTDMSVKIVVMNAAICDFEMDSPSDEARLSSQKDYPATLKGVKTKIIAKIKSVRPDIIVCGFKTTHGATRQEQLDKATESMKSSGIDMVLANDLETRSNVLVSGRCYYDDRDSLLRRMLMVAVSKCSQ
jgi:hypothetical protein